MPRVSVVLTAHNEEGVIAEAISSIVAQTFSDFELVVVDDGSTDRTVEIVERFRDPRLRVIRQMNTGQPVAMNSGIRAAAGDLIARHDADDLSLPQRFSRQVAFLDAHPEIALVGTGAVMRDAQSRDRPFRALTTSRQIRLALAWGNPIVHTSVMMRRSALEAVGAYTDMQFEDYDLWIRMAESFPLANLPDPLVIRRLREGSRGRSGPRSDALWRKAKLQRLAIERLRLPVSAWFGLAPTLAGAAVFSTVERMANRAAPGAARRA